MIGMDSAIVKELSRVFFKYLSADNTQVNLGINRTPNIPTLSQ